MVSSSHAESKQHLYKVPGISNTADAVIPCFVTGRYSLQNTCTLVLLFQPHNSLRKKARQGLLSSFFSWGTKSSKGLVTCPRTHSSWVEELELHSDMGPLCLRSLCCVTLPCCFPQDVCSTNNQEGKQGTCPMDCHHEYEFLQKEFLVFLEVLLDLTINHRRGQLPQLRE